jgi:hypothetical protein
MNRAFQGRYGGVAEGLLISMVVVLMACGTGSDSSSSITSTASNDEHGENSISDMNLGEVQFLDFGSGQGLDINFDGSSGQDTYLAVIHSRNVQEGSFNIVIQGDTSTSTLASSPASLEFDTSVPGIEDLDDQAGENPMHELVRAWSSVYATSPYVNPVEPQTTTLPALTSALSVGSTRNFRALNSLSSITSYDTIEARLRYVSNNLYVYVDTVMDNSNYLVDEDINELANSLEEHSLPIERDLFGTESDVNGDGHITILMTPVLNEMCSSTGIVTGFFFPGDLYEQNDSNPASNEQEIFYTLVPDPTGQFCRALGIDFAMQNILPGVLAHEFQHMVSFNQHVFLSGGTTEEPWLSEALSHLAEDITGNGPENYSRVKLFLDRANSTTLIPPGLPSLAERGMGYLFTRYLYEQAADSEVFINRLLATDKTGVGNIEDALKQASATVSDFNEAFAYWQVALALSGTGLTDDSRFTYKDRVIDSVTGNYRGMCLYCDAEDGRGTILSGPALTDVPSLPLAVDIDSTQTRFFQIEAPGTNLSISGSSGLELGGALIRLEAK